MRLRSLALVAFAVGCRSAPAQPPSAEPPTGSIPQPQGVAAIEPLETMPDAGLTLAPGEETERSRCPLDVAGALVEAEEVPDGAALVFRLDREERSDELDRLRHLAQRFTDALTNASQQEQRSDRGSEPDQEQEPQPESLLPVRVRVEYSEAPGGAVIVFTPEEPLAPEDERGLIDGLRARVRIHAETLLAGGPCPVLPAPGLETI
jgi:hypothetical protein